MRSRVRTRRTARLPVAKKPRPRDNTRSKQAARWAEENDVSYQEAAKRFKITPQAVQQGWAKLFPDRNRFVRCGWRRGDKKRS